MNRELSSFEEGLLRELREHVAELARFETVTTPPTRRSHRRVVVTAGAIAIAVTSFLLLPGIGSSPAYSVSEGNEGEIRVEVNRPEDAAGLERALAERGIAADITYLPELQICAPGRYTEVDRATSGLTTSISKDSIAVTIPPGTIRDGETFVLVWSVETDDSFRWTGPRNRLQVSVDFAVAAGDVAQCEPIGMVDGGT